MIKNTLEGASNAWVAFVDVYGFTQLLRDSKGNLVDLHRRIEQAQKASQVRFEKKGVKYFPFSDNLFIAVPTTGSNNADALELLLSAVREAIDKHIVQDLPLRGGIAFGPVSFSSGLLVGEPVIRAVEYEKSVGLPMVILPEYETSVCADIHGLIKKFIKIPYPASSSRPGILSVCTIIPKRPHGYVEYANRRMEQFSINGPPHVAFAWQEVVKLIGQN
ncbi:hypothetical protein [Rhizobium sp. RU36D]|uniref:hypothetical protein n=1 Tax=Rhizobium sp. RU36D TaxID=1907415 RepID=UPI0009D8FDA0|nr:hypothetical protein [Rhizobium sp. RU36D]SMD14520.1 hypothetical protein SAMN05880593_12636 [Rhizobium sp. RU36D]